jgi:hypothetical protein
MVAPEGPTLSLGTVAAQRSYNESLSKAPPGSSVPGAARYPEPQAAATAKHKTALKTLKYHHNRRND